MYLTSLSGTPNVFDLPRCPRKMYLTSPLAPSIVFVILALPQCIRLPFLAAQSVFDRACCPPKMYCQANACHTPRPTQGGLDFIHMNKSLGAASEPSIVWACIGTREDARKWILAPASKPQWPSHWWELGWGPLPPPQYSPLVGASLDQITKNTFAGQTRILLREATVYVEERRILPQPPTEV